MLNPSKLLVQPSCTPITFLQRVLLHQHEHHDATATITTTTTVLICASKSDFLQTALSELHDEAEALALNQDSQHLPADTTPNPDPDPGPVTSTAHKRSILKATLGQVSAARHIHVVFIPTIAHLRAYLSVFPFAAAAAAAAVVAPPPSQQLQSQKIHQQQQQQQQQQHLLLYGFLDLHRDGTEWSAQGIGCSAACLAEAVTRAAASSASSASAVLMEPTSWTQDGSRDDVHDSTAASWTAYEERIPVLGPSVATSVGGTGGVPSVSARSILERWFVF